MCDEKCPAKLICGVSGGRDSQTTAHELERKGQLAAIFVIDTGISLPDVVPFVREYWEGRGVQVLVVRTPAVYEDIVLRYGFPGSPQHNTIMNMLKGRAVRELKKKLPGAEIATGVRRDESERRWRQTEEHGEWEGVKMHAPIANWSNSKVREYIKENQIPISPAYEHLHYSGECLCGSYADWKESYILETFYPKVGARIRQLEQQLDKKYEAWLVAGSPAEKSEDKEGRIIMRPPSWSEPWARRWGGWTGGSGFTGAGRQMKLDTLEGFFCPPSCRERKD